MRHGGLLRFLPSLAQEGVLDMSCYPPGIGWFKTQLYYPQVG